MISFALSFILTLLSVFCIMGSPAAFTPAVGLAFFLMAICGPIAYFGHLRVAVLNLGLTSVAVGISPVTDMSQFGHSISLAVLYAVPFIFGYGGVLHGVSKLQRKAHA